MKNEKIMFIIKEFKNIIENYWWIMVAPDYMQFLFILVFDNNLYKTYLVDNKGVEDEQES